MLITQLLLEYRAITHISHEAWDNCSGGGGAQFHNPAVLTDHEHTK